LANLTRAQVALRCDEAAPAALRLEQLLRDGALSATNRSLAEGYLGEAYDRLGRYDDAFAAFARANELQHARWRKQYQDDRGPLAPTSLRRLHEFVATTDAASWSAAPSSSRPEPVFLIGFPRSGTTLLDQILASHPRVATLEERDNLATAALELIRDDERFARWATLPATDIERLRADYWRQVDAGMGAAPANKLFVDKLPLNAAYLPLIYRLFPNARVLLALRDPRDVLLSCFQQRFGMNAAMFQLLRLDTAAAYYDAVMRVVSGSRARLSLRVHAVKYESLIADFDGTVRPMLDFLGLEWSDSVRDYAATAKQRTIATPSAAQVVRPIYRSAHGKWRNYRHHMEAQLPILRPWLEAFGYAEN
jgi:hypothetical protein